MKTLKKICAVIFSLTLFSCNSGNEKNFKKACIEVEILKDGKFVTVDSCFVAPTRDSLDRMLATARSKQTEFVEYSTKLLFVIVDTLQKKPEDYQYALVRSDAGIINPDVVLTSDPSIVKENTDKFAKANIIFQKVVVGRSLKSMVETIFTTNIRINYRWESNVKLKN